MSRGRKGFHPRMVPEVRNGYFWLVKDATGIGTTSFRVPEGNKHPTFDLVQTTVANQPTVLTENGGIQFRMLQVGQPSPSIISTSGAVQAGWTGSTYIAGWFRLPNASGSVTGAGNLFAHTAATDGQRRVNFSNLISSGGKQGVTASKDGTAAGSSNNQWVNIFSDGVGGSWFWTEVIIISATSVELYSNKVITAHSLTATPDAVLFDGNALLAIGCRAAAGLANVDCTDWCNVYYCNGIPNLKNRIRLANYLNPSNIKF